MQALANNKRQFIIMSN